LQEVRQLFLDGPLIEEDIPDFIWKLPLLHLKVLTINGAEDMYPDFFGKENFPLLRTMFQEASSQNTDYDYPFLKTLFLAKAGSFVFRTKEKFKECEEIGRYYSRMEKTNGSIIRWNGLYSSGISQTK